MACSVVINHYPTFKCIMHVVAQYLHGTFLTLIKTLPGVDAYDLILQMRKDEAQGKGTSIIWHLPSQAYRVQISADEPTTIYLLQTIR